MKILWKLVYEELHKEALNLQYGARFYSLAEICKRYDVSDITARRVLQELQKEGLVVKIKGRGTIVSRANKGSFSINLLFSEANFPYGTVFDYAGLSIYSGICLQAEKYKLPLIVSYENYLAEMSAGKSDKQGFLFIGFLPSKECMRVITERKHPFVIIQGIAKSQGMASVMYDREQGAFQAVNHLISLGHKRIALVTGPIANPVFLPIYQGYRRALVEADIELDLSLVRETPDNVKAEDDSALQEMLEYSMPPTSVFAVYDKRAINILDYCLSNGIRVPEDLSVVGFGNSPEASFDKYSLTTVETHLDIVGKEAVNVLVDLGMSGKTCQPDMVIKPDLIVRKSTMQIGLADGKKRVISVCREECANLLADREVLAGTV